MVRETALASWKHAGVSYAVATQCHDGGPLIVLVAAIGPGRRTRSGHQLRPNSNRELASQLAKWNGLTDAGRTREAEVLLGCSS